MTYFPIITVIKKWKLPLGSEGTMGAPILRWRDWTNRNSGSRRGPKGPPTLFSEPNPLTSCYWNVKAWHSPDFLTERTETVSARLAVWLWSIYFHCPSCLQTVQTALPPMASLRYLCSRRRGLFYLLEPALACLFPISSASFSKSPFLTGEHHKAKPKVVMMVIGWCDDVDDAIAVADAEMPPISKALYLSKIHHVVPLLILTVSLGGRQGKNYSLSLSLFGTQKIRKCKQLRVFSE